MEFHEFFLTPRRAYSNSSKPPTYTFSKHHSQIISITRAFCFELSMLLIFSHSLSTALPNRFVLSFFSPITSYDFLYVHSAIFLKVSWVVVFFLATLTGCQQGEIVSCILLFLVATIMSFTPLIWRRAWLSMWLRKDLPSILCSITFSVTASIFSSSFIGDQVRIRIPALSIL